MKLKLDPYNLPEHIAVIMDGNGRWARKKGAERIFGHRNAIKAIRDITEGSAELGINYLTLYAFSTENWGRPKREVNGLMKLLVSTIRNEMETLVKNNVKLMTIGKVDSLPQSCQFELAEAIEETSTHTGLTLTLALSYSGRDEIIDGIKNLSEDLLEGRIGIQSINNDTFANYLESSFLPDPELLIRTSGEMRISNFLLWQIAYTEIYITDKLWPDFRREDLYEAIDNFQKRERRFGKISEQVKS